MKRRALLGLIASLPMARVAPVLAASPVVEVFKNPDCGCCSEWVKHLKSAGFSVKVTDVSDTAPIRKRFGMPDDFSGCHTATVEGYVVEGHVPAADVARLLKKRPSAVGIAVPGMPAGSPGMEVGNRVDPYDVLLVDRAGRASVFARYPKQ